MKRLLLFILYILCSFNLLGAQPSPINIVWIVIEDASPHLGCYGESLIKTPNIDQMSREGIRFKNAFVTAPVCSPSRSAMISGMYQTTLGAHNHRSQNSSKKGGGNKSYYQSYRVPKSLKLIPELFRDAGYYVTNKTKTDYNFIPNGKLYEGTQWKKAPNKQPIFAQFQLRGGKNRSAQSQVDPRKVILPPAKYHKSNEKCPQIDRNQTKVGNAPRIPAGAPRRKYPQQNPPGASRREYTPRFFGRAEGIGPPPNRLRGAEYPRNFSGRAEGTGHPRKPKQCRGTFVGLAKTKKWKRLSTTAPAGMNLPLSWGTLPNN